jgi:hypothetical protein
LNWWRKKVRHFSCRLESEVKRGCPQKGDLSQWGACSEKRWAGTAANDSTAENRKRPSARSSTLAKRPKLFSGQASADRRQHHGKCSSGRTDGLPLRIRTPRFLSSLNARVPRTALYCNSKKVHACDGRVDDSSFSLRSVLEFSIGIIRNNNRKEFSTALHRGGPVNHNEDGAQC